MYDVIIVGGGAAGLMAAKILSAAGKKILLLEARENLGGRIHRLTNFSIPAEGGAEFIHGNLKTTFALLREAQFKKAKVKGQFYHVEGGKWKSDNELVPHWDNLVKRMKKCKKDLSVADFIRLFYHAKKYDTLREQFTQYVQGYDAADIKYTSLFAVRKEMEEEDEEEYRPIPDYTSLIGYLHEKCFESNVHIKTGEPVLRIVNGDVPEVITPGGTFSGQKVIIAVPLGILQCDAGSKGYIDFPGCLKEHIRAANKIGNGGVIKFLFEFEDAFWLSSKFLKKRNIKPPSYIFSDTIIPTWWTQHPSRKPLLTGWIGGPAAHKLRSYSERKLKNAGLESVSVILSIPVKELEEKLTAFKVMNWTREPYILGGYSYSTLAAENARKLLRQPVENRFYFAGEYAAENSLSTVDAALQSGKEVAGKILGDD